MLIRPYFNEKTKEAAYVFEFIDESEFRSLIQSLENCLSYVGACRDNDISDSKDEISFDAIALLKERLQKETIDPDFSLMSLLTLNEASIFMTDILQTNVIMLAAALTERNNLETQIAELNEQYRLDMFKLFEEWASKKEK